MSFAAHATCSSSSMTEESSHPQRRNKRYVKKKGETRKKNSAEISSSQQLKDPVEIDETSKKLAKVTFKGEKKGGEGMSDKEAIGAENRSAVNEAAESKTRKYEDGMKSKGKKNDDGVEAGGESAAAGAENKRQKESTVVNQSANDKEKKSRKDEEKMRDRKAAKFVKTVVRFSAEFAKAATELGIVEPEKAPVGAEEDSTSLSDSSLYSRTDDTCSTSCTCSHCCTDDTSSSCSCSDCNSQEGCSSNPSSYDTNDTSCSIMDSDLSNNSVSTNSPSSGPLASGEKNFKK